MPCNFWTWLSATTEQCCLSVFVRSLIRSFVNSFVTDQTGHKEILKSFGTSREEQFFTVPVVAIEPQRIRATHLRGYSSSSTVVETRNESKSKAITTATTICDSVLVLYRGDAFHFHKSHLVPSKSLSHNSNFCVS